MNAVDTNILLYVQDPRDALKQATAVQLTTALPDGVLLWQVACEYVAASRKLVAFGYSQQQAYADLLRIHQMWRFVAPTWQVFTRAETLRQRYALSFWDSMVVSAALEAGVTRLYSEDFDAYKTIDGLTLINPFKP
jgi:predicted nucleic acid-binding protein